MEFVQQRGRADCGIAAISMFTDRPYDEVWEAGVVTGQFVPKKGMYGEGQILEHLGYFWENLGRHPDHPAPHPEGRPFRSLFLEYSGVKGEFIGKLMWGRPALVSIVSLNHPPHGRHLVVFDGERILDPQEGRRGKKFATSFDQVDVTEAWVWSHLSH